MKLKFHKMHGLGNDFVIIQDLDPNALDLDKRKFLCDRKLGIGCDQLILCSKKFKKEKSNEDYIEMRIYNTDGSESTLCGNATRCVGALYITNNNNNPEKLLIKTINKDLPVTRNGDLITVNMGKVILDWQEIPLSCSLENNELKVSLTSNDGKRLEFTGYCISVGNPHIVIFIDDFNFDLIEIGSYIQNLSYFPKKVNVDFAKLINNRCIELKVYERGAGLTMACGSGACATFYTARKKGIIENDAEIRFKIGSLYIKLNDSEDILMTGGFTYVYDGTIEI